MAPGDTGRDEVQVVYVSGMFLFECLKGVMGLALCHIHIMKIEKMHAAFRPSHHPLRISMGDYLCRATTCIRRPRHPRGRTLLA